MLKTAKVYPFSETRMYMYWNWFTMYSTMIILEDFNLYRRKKQAKLTKYSRKIEFDPIHPNFITSIIVSE